MNEQAVDATATLIDEHGAEVDRPAAQSMTLAPRERRSEVIRPLDAGQLEESFRAYQELCHRLLDPSDYQQAGKKSFKKKSAWRKLATAFDLDVALVRTSVERDEHGQPLRASVIARAISPSGRYQDGDGHCSVDEPRFREAKGREKLEHDLPSTAATRAKNRAISDLLGTGEVSAEEVSASADSGPAFGPEFSGDKAALMAAIERLVGSHEHARGVAAGIVGEAGYMPAVVARAIQRADSARLANDDRQTADVPDAETVEPGPSEEEMAAAEAAVENAKQEGLL